MRNKWKTKDGRYIDLKDMEQSHLMNAIAYSKRLGRYDTVRILEAEKKRRENAVGFEPSDESVDNALTFQEWSDAGYRVKKGEKSGYRSPLGDALFTPSQVSLWEHCTDRSRAKGTPWGVVADFDSFVREAGMMPGNSPTFAVNDPLERHFMEVADKHGVLDAILDDDRDDWY